jgi:hypothetical protein
MKASEFPACGGFLSMQTSLAMERLQRGFQGIRLALIFLAVVHIRNIRDDRSYSITILLTSKRPNCERTFRYSQEVPV